MVQFYSVRTDSALSILITPALFYSMDELGTLGTVQYLLDSTTGLLKLFLFFEGGGVSLRSDGMSSYLSFN